jgi:hypothetical protein
VNPMDPTVAGILYLIAIVLAVVASFDVVVKPALFPLAFAVFVVPFMWNAFAA